ncbi:MAG: WXG100 family type VII secretion target [Anaerolineales bacterium]
MTVEDITMQVDYDGLDGIVSQLNEMNDQAIEMRDLLQRHTDELEGGKWKGKGFDAYRKEYDELIRPALDRLVEGTEEAANTVKKMKGETQTLEEEIKSAWDEMINQIPGA